MMGAFAQAESESISGNIQAGKRYAMQRGEVPLRVIDGEVDPISGAHMVARYRELIPNPDTVLLAEIGHYPQTEAPVQVLKHYLEFRDRLILPPRRFAYS